MTRLISSCCADRPRGSLATSISSTSAGSSPSSSRGASRSATTTSASIRAFRPATDMSSGSPGPPPTRTTPGERSRWCRRRDGSLAQALQDLVADAGRAARVPVPQDRHSHPGVPAHGGGPGRRGSGVVAADAEDPTGLGAGADRLVDCRVVGRRDHVPGPVEVLVAEAPFGPLDLTGADQTLDGRSHLRRDDVHLGAGGDQRGDPALCDLARTDHHDPATGQAQAGGVRRELHAAHSPGSVAGARSTRPPIGLG